MRYLQVPVVRDGIPRENQVQIQRPGGIRVRPYSLARPLRAEAIESCGTRSDSHADRIQVRRVVPGAGPTGIVSMISETEVADEGSDLLCGFANIAFPLSHVRPERHENHKLKA
jgi:hypothetical protein